MVGDFSYLLYLDPCDKNCNISCHFENVIFVDFLAVKVNRSDVTPGICLVTPQCFTIQTSHGFKNFCLFSSNSTYSVQNQVIYFQYVYKFTVTQIPGLTSLPLTLTAKKSMKIKFSNDKIYCNSYHRVPNIINL